MTPIVMTIAGSDSSGGAGIQADLKTFSALGVYGASVITAVTAQNTLTVSAIHAIPTHLIKAQIETVLSDLKVNAIKIGMLANKEIIQCVADCLVDCRIPLIIDPVMIAKSGDTLLTEDSIDTLRRKLLPQAELLTPNLPEAAKLLNRPVAEDMATIIEQGKRLCDMGSNAVLMKGGHARGENCHDYLINANQEDEYHEYVAERVHTSNTHGTGCTLSAAIAAGLALGLNLPQATNEAIAFVQKAINCADLLSIGSGHGPVHHFHGFW
ncbi:MAG: bifunctional hydroxymethylpyrimidine kinase/phosphomethylpyrimidine kinase [Rhodobacteraceae bacterium]|nr:bifunctional hydroxymethylpyrimidine kinase/phosphomethylpyrimidine kinase [Paracoccaceae bacterium]MCY4250005.1 bifunctional hydroxymethylpyrimidine kinase/phosphomethylpyrimidine kinase [Paracoccaceae bacterium]